MATQEEVTLVIHFKEDKKEQKIKISKDFNETKKNILNVFGIDDKEISNYALKIPSGGLIEKNNVIFDKDKLCIIPVEMSNEPTGCTPMNEFDYKIKEEMMREANMDPNNKEHVRKFAIHKVTKSDYDILECLLLTKQYTEYHALSDLINKKWAYQLGFSMKLLRPPKSNKDGTKTIRLYCTRFNRGKNQNEKENGKPTENQEEEDCCRFGITFKQDNETRIWLLYQEFDQNSFIHNHKCTERPNYLEINKSEYDIEECCKKYKRKIKSLIILQKLIDQKNDLVVKQRDILDEKSRRERKIKVKQEITKSFKKKDKPVINGNGVKHQDNKQKDIGSARNVSSQQELNVLFDILKKK